MEMILTVTAAGILWVTVWVIYVMIQTLIYGSLMCATGFGGIYIGSCVTSPDLFTFGDIALTSSGIVSFLLMVAAFVFLRKFWEEGSIAMARILNPFAQSAKT